MNATSRKGRQSERERASAFLYIAIPFIISYRIAYTLCSTVDQSKPIECTNKSNAFEFVKHGEGTIIMFSLKIIWIRVSIWNGETSPAIFHQFISRLLFVMVFNDKLIERAHCRNVEFCVRIANNRECVRLALMVIRFLVS